MDSPRRRAGLRQKGWSDVSQLERSRHPRGNTSPPRSLKNGRKAAEILASFFPKKSTLFIGPKICTGASRASASCVRYAGWLPCSMEKLFRWSLTESRQGRRREVIASSAMASVEISSAREYAIALEKGRCESRSHVWSKFAKLWTRPLVPFPAPAGGKIKLCWIPSSI